MTQDEELKQAIESCKEEHIFLEYKNMLRRLDDASLEALVKCIKSPHKQLVLELIK
jgi:hypothetical protein